MKTRIFYTRRDRAPIRWVQSKSTGVIHASRAGDSEPLRAVCGTVTVLAELPPVWYEPSNDLMTCETCAGLVLCRSVEEDLATVP